jgi:hypothetical protein
LRCSLSTEEAYSFLRGSVSEIKATGLRAPIVRPEVALTVITFVSHQLRYLVMNASTKILDMRLHITKRKNEIKRY